MPRRASLFVFLGFAVTLVFATGISTGAEAGGGSIKAKKADVAAAQDRLMEIRLEASSAEASYNNALYEMNQLNGQIKRANEDLDAARERFKAAKKSLEDRAALVYKSGNVAYMDVLVGVDNFSEFASRLDLWIRLLDQEREDFVEVRDAKKELLERKDRLEAEREQRVEAVERAIAQKQRAEKAEAYLNSLNADLRDAIQAAQDRKSEQARAAAAAMVETAPEDKAVPEPVPVSEPAPIPEVQASQVKRVPVPKPDLGSEQAAADREAAAKAAAAKAKRLAEQRVAEREAAREAAEQAAAERDAAARAARLAAAQRETRQEAREEAQRQAELAAQRAVERAAERQAAREAAERRAERAAIEEAAAEQAAAERAAARRAAEQAADRRAEKRAAERAAEASASASASATASASASTTTSKNSGSGGGGRSDASASSSASASASASASSSAARGGGLSAMGGDVLAVAQQHLGTPYVLSPPGPCATFEAEDCSCFTMLVFQECGVALPDTPGGQMGYGTPVRGAPQAGDLLFWSEDGSGYITHVGIAMGDGTSIHASNYTGEVSITSINYIPGYVGARRVL